MMLTMISRETALRWCKQVLTVLLFVVFCSCFVLQVWQQVVKFLGRATVTVVEEDRDPNLRFPVVTVCPLKGYKNGTASVSENSKWFPYGNTSTYSIDQVQELWREYTYSASELLDLVAVYHDGVYHKIDSFETGQTEMMISNSTLRVSEQNTISYGRCAIVDFDYNIQQVANIWVDIKTKFGPVILFLTEPGPNRMGVSAEYWTRDYHMLKMLSGISHIAAVRKKIDYMNENSKPCEHQRTADFMYHCFENHVLEYVDIRGGTDKFCYLPQINISMQGFPSCENEDQAFETYVTIRNGIIDASKDSVCLESCEVETYDLTVRQRLLDPVDGSTQSAFFGMYFLTPLVVKSHQVALYDLNSIVAAVGGSMGIFLGFSCLDFTTRSIDFLVDSMSHRLAKKTVRHPKRIQVSGKKRKIEAT